MDENVVEEVCSIRCGTVVILVEEIDGEVKKFDASYGIFIGKFTTFCNLEVCKPACCMATCTMSEL